MMLRLLLIILLVGVSACSSTATEVAEPDPFAGAEPVEEGLYADLPDEPVSTTWAPVRVLNDEWKRSVAGWSFTTRAIGRWTQRDWDRLFGSGK
jgi:hypothetical protein